MNLFDIIELKDALFSNRYKSNIYNISYEMLNKITELIATEDILLLYPKGVIVEENKNDTESIEIICLTKSLKILIIRAIGDSKNININVKLREQITDMNLEYFKTEYGFNSNKLKIKFNDGTDIILNGENDTNNYWGEEFSKKIIEIFKLLID